jgi:tetratricopeptide (TPR) repeat protein
MLNRKVLFSLVLISALAMAMFGMFGCGGQEEEPLLASDVAADGWKLYESKNMEDSLKLSETKFQKAVSVDPNYTDGYVGLGWTYGKMSNLKDSIDNFMIALSKEPQNLDALAGIAIAYLANDQYDQAIDSANKVLTNNPGYIFSHGNITSKHIHIILAESYYYTGDFVNTQKQIDILNPVNGLDPTSKDYAEKLLKELEKAANA